MTEYDVLLRELASLYRLDLSYEEASPGRPWVHMKNGPLERYFEARGIPYRTIEELHESIAFRRLQLRQQLVRPVQSGACGKEFHAVATVPAGVERYELRWAADGSSFARGSLVQSGAQSVGPDGQTYCETTFSIPALGTGFHDFHIDLTGQPGAGLEYSSQFRLIAAPDKFWQPETKRRRFGVTSILQTLRSGKPTHLGRGNTADALAAIDYFGRAGASFFAGGPCASFDWPLDLPTGTPFMPVSQQLMAHQWLDVAGAIERLRLENARGYLASGEVQSLVDELKASKILRLYEYDCMLMDLLARMWGEFKERHLSHHTDEARSFETFLARERARLEPHALFVTLREHFFPRDSFTDLWDHRLWPAEYQDPASQAVQEFKVANEDRLRFVIFVQWLVDFDLRRLDKAARAAGMDLGIMMNLPVGRAWGAAETWVNPKLFFKKIVQGVPPDPLDARGQSWGYPLADPDVIEKQFLKPFIDPMMTLVEHGGVVEIDHAGFMEHCFGYPLGLDAADGVFIRYPLEAMLRALSAVTHLRQVVAVPELVGTVSSHIEERMRDYGANPLVYMRYTLDSNAQFVRPSGYRAEATILGSTHNTFPDISWLTSYDLLLDEQHRGKPQGNAVAGRLAEVCSLLNALRELGLITDDEAEELRNAASTPAASKDDVIALAQTPLGRRFNDACHAFRAHTNCELMTVHLPEATLEPDADNMPGVGAQYPSWLQKQTAVEELPMSPMASVLATVAAIRPPDQG